MTSTEDTFYEGKRPWSVVKDQVIGDYIPPFTRKVATLGRPILLIDAFAGPGVFDDGKPGSPLIICNAASGVNAEWQAVFINRNKHHHDKLTAIIGEAGWSDNTQTLLGDSSIQLQELQQGLTNETIFLYLDPFGLSGCDFKIIRSYLEKAKEDHNVEIVINVSMPTLHRLATPKAVAEGRKADPKIASLHQTLSDALGGSWWQEIMWAADLEPADKEAAVMRRYSEQVKTYLPYTGYLPVRENATAATKYYITFATGHPDGLVLMNDIMLRAYERYIFRAEAGDQGTLWDWETGRSVRGLDDAILETVAANPGHARGKIWSLLVQDYFLMWLEKEYNAELKKLANENRIIYPPDPRTGRRNKNSCLSLPD